MSTAQRPRYSVIIPAYNEAERISAVLTEYAPVFADSEIIVVLNGCIDETPAIVKALSRIYPNIRYAEISAAVGKGGAIRAGFLMVKADVVAYVDADGATSPEELRRLCEVLGEDDVIIGSRWLAGSKLIAKQPLTRRIASRVFNLFVRCLFGLPFQDTQCGAKVFKAAALKNSVPNIETANLAFDVDLLYHLREQGYRVREVSTTWRDQAGSKVNILSASPKMLGALLRLRLRYSIFRTLIPLFDRLVPTHPLRVHDRLNVLVLNWRDPKHPRAGGAETYLHEMAKRWVAQGHRVEWLTAGFAGGSRTDVIDGVRITRVGNRVTVYGAIPIEYLRNFRDRFDIIIDAENGLPFFTPLYSMKPRILLMFHVHKPVFLKQLPAGIGNLFAWIETKVMPVIYADTPFVAISQDTKRALEAERMTSQGIEVVLSGVDSRCVPGEKAPVPTIAYTGRLQRYKRVDALIAAMPSILERVPEARLIVVGTGDERDRLEQMARSLGIGHAVSFTGFVDEETKIKLLAGAWVFVSPSSMEGWGITAAEALACGTPCVVYDVPGLREVVEDGRCGFVLSEGSELSRPILEILTDASLREKLSAAAAARGRAFSWDRAAADMLNVLVRFGAQLPYNYVRRGEEWHLIKGSIGARAVSQNTSQNIEMPAEPVGP